MNEKQLIAKYLEPIARSPESLGLQDDVAMLKMGLCTNKAYSIFTMDTLVEGIHFNSFDLPRNVAKKLLRVNISDIISKGVKPQFYLLSIALPRFIGENWLSDFTIGLKEDNDFYKISLIGGDSVVSPDKIVLSVTAFGFSDNPPILRSGAKIGDSIYVTGTLGDSCLGLMSIRKQIEHDDYLIGRYLLPSPRYDMAQDIAKYAHASADISDGIISDLENICKASKVGANIHLDKLPLSKIAKTKYLNLRNHILTWGDDYEIVFSGKEGLEKVINGVTKVGEITCNSDVRIFDNGSRIFLDKTGFSHF